MRSLIEPADVDSSLLRSQIDRCFLKAMAAAREQMENSGYDSKPYEEASVNSEISATNSKVRSGVVPNQSFATTSNGSRPPRYGGRGSRTIKNNNGHRNLNGQNKQWRGRGANRMYGTYMPQDQSMLMQPHMQQGMYNPYFNHSYAGGYVPSHYVHQSMNNSICGWNHPYGGNDYSNLNMSVSGEWDQQYYGNQYDVSMDTDPSFYKCDESIANTSIASLNHFEGAQYVSHFPVPHNVMHRQDNGASISGQERSMPNSANASFDESSTNGNDAAITMQTPSKERSNANIGTPASPSWAHLHTVPGLATPVTQHGPSSHHMIDNSETRQNNRMGANAGMRASSNWMNAKPLLINPNFNQFPQVRFQK